MTRCIRGPYSALFFATDSDTGPEVATLALNAYWRVIETKINLERIRIAV